MTEEVKQAEDNSRIVSEPPNVDLTDSSLDSSSQISSDEHLNFGGNLDLTPDNDGLPSQTPPATPPLPSEQEEGGEHYLDNKDDFKQQDNKDDQLNSQREEFLHDHTELNEEESYAKKTPLLEPMNTLDITYESQEPPPTPSQVDITHTPDSTPDASQHEPVSVTEEHSKPISSFEYYHTDKTTFEPSHTPTPDPSPEPTVNTLVTPSDNGELDDDKISPETGNDGGYKYNDYDEDYDYEDENDNYNKDYDEDDDHNDEDDDHGSGDEDDDHGDEDDREGGSNVPPSPVQTEEEIRRAQKIEEMQRLYKEQQELLRQQELLHRQAQDGSAGQQSKDESLGQTQYKEEEPASSEHDRDTEEQESTMEDYGAPITSRRGPSPPAAPVEIPSEVPIPPTEVPIPPTEVQTPYNCPEVTPCHCPDVTPPPCNCPDVTPPPCECPDMVPPYLKPSMGEYVPLPGSDSGILSLVEQYRVYVREMVFATLPQSISEWIMENVSLN